MNFVRIRIAISLFILTLFVLLFCGPENLSSFLAAALLPFQFVPAFIRILNHPATVFIIGFCAIMIITLIFGRVYCSFLCPLGTLQDIFIALSEKLGWRRKPSFRKPMNALRYGLLGAVVITASLGFMSLLNVLDPYSITGRMMTQFVLPFSLWIYNAAIGLMKNFDIYFFSKDTVHFFFTVLLVNAGLFMLIAIMALRYGRLYCNTMCPVGTLLGLISRVSLLKFTVDKSGCTECFNCETVCKADCIDTKNAVIDHSRCVACFNCVGACPQSVVKYSRVSTNAQHPAWSPARRGFVVGAIAAAGTAFFTFNAPLRHLLPAAQASSPPPVTPPGSGSLARFTKSCSACHLCVSACPTKVIAPSFLAYGVGGFLQPMMDYPASYCEYDCTICSQVCPTGALLPLSAEEKKTVQIGKVDLLADKCVVYVNHTNCGACVEVCPTRTITFTDKGNILYPVVDDRYCVGCGACTKACPTTPKSIVVRAHSVHQKALIHDIDEGPVRPKIAVPEEFPF